MWIGHTHPPSGTASCPSGTQERSQVSASSASHGRRRLPRFESRAGFATWLYRIAVNCSLDLLRSRRRREERTGSSCPPVLLSGGEPLDAVASLPAGDPGPDQLLFSSEVRARVEKALARLSPNERAAFVMRHFEGRPVEEIGRLLGLRTSATKNTVFRAIQKLRRALEPVVRTRSGRRVETTG